MSEKQNSILLITCDELNREVLGIYGNRAISMPNIDAIGNCGTRFDNAYTVSPWCLPARCSILTGLYPHRSGAYSNFRKCALVGTIPNIFTGLHTADYTVAMFGKCHFAPVPYSQTRPDVTLPYDEFKEYYMSLGLDHLDLEDDKQVSVWFRDDWAKEAEADGTLEAMRRAVWDRSLGKVYPFPGPLHLHPDAWVGDKATEYIKNADPDKPLFAWVSFSGPHYPMDAPEEYIKRVDADRLTPRKYREGELEGTDRIHHKDYYGRGNIDGCSCAPDAACRNYDEAYWKRMRTNYNAVVSLIDDKVGEIVSAAREKYGDDLLIIFTADHGEMLGDHGIWGKHNCAYDEVWRIPMLISFPHGEQAGEVRCDIMNSCDILPTCLEAASAEPIACDGVSVYRETDRKYTFAEGEGFMAVTDGKAKYVHIRKRGKNGNIVENYREFTDLVGDPDEFENRIGCPECQAKLAELRGVLIDHVIDRVLP